MSTNYFKNISYLVIETNSSCNLKCISCNREALKELGIRTDKYLTIKEFEERLKKFKDCAIDTIKLEGISEPMLHPDFAQMCELLNKYFPKAFKIIATNCQYNVEKSPFYTALKFVDMVYLSIDGTGELYERLRRGASWKKLLKFLDHIDQTLPKTIRNEKLFINFTLTNENFLELEKMYALKEQYSLAGVRINLAQNWSQNEKNSNEFKSELLKHLEKYKKDLKGVPSWNYSDCFWPFEGVVVDVFGDIRQCLINTSQRPIFNIDSGNFEEYYNSSKHYTDTRASLSKNCAPDECTTCDYKFLGPILKDVFGDDQSTIKPRQFKR